MKKHDPQNEFAKSKNELVDYLLLERKFVDVTMFVNIIRFHCFLLVESRLKENGEDVNLEMTRDKFTKVTTKLFQLMDSDLLCQK